MKHDGQFTFKLGEGVNARSYSYPLTDVRQVAKAIGMDLELDKGFMWFLKQALVTILPQGGQEESDTARLAQYRSREAVATADVQPLLYVFRTAFHRLNQTTVSKKSMIERTGERKLTTRERRLAPTDVVSLQSATDQSALFSNLAKKKQAIASDLSQVQAALQEVELFYSALVPGFAVPTAIEESLEYKCVDPKDVLTAANELGIAAEFHLYWVARLYCAVSLPPLWKRTYDAFRSIVFVNQYYDLTLNSHPGKGFFTKFLQRLRFEPVTSYSPIITFLDREFKEYDVDLRKLAEGNNFVIEVRSKPMIHHSPSLFHQKSIVSEELNDVMALEIAESCGVVFSEEIHLLGVVYSYFAEMKAKGELTGWEFRYTVEGQKYWYHPQTQRASKSYPFRSQLKALVNSARIGIHRKFERTAREISDLHPVFVGKDNDFLSFVRFSASDLMRNFLRVYLERGKKEEEDASELLKSLEFAPKSRGEFDAALFACPFPLLLAQVGNDPAAEGDFESEGESLGIVEQEDINDILDDIRKEIGRPESLLKREVTGLSGRPKPPASYGFRKGGQKPLPPSALLQGLVPIVDEGMSESQDETPRVSQEESELFPKPPSSAANSIQSLVQNILSANKGLKTPNSTGRIVAWSTAISQAIPRSSEGSVVTDVLSDREISVVKSLREKLNIPAIEIKKKMKTEVTRSEKRYKTVKLVDVGDSLQERKLSRQMTSTSGKAKETKKSAKGKASPKTNHLIPTVKVAEENPKSKSLRSPKSPKSPISPPKKFSLHIDQVASNVSHLLEGPEGSFPRTRDEEEPQKTENEEDFGGVGLARETQKLLDVLETEPIVWKKKKESTQELGSKQETQAATVEEQEISPSREPYVRRRLARLFVPLVTAQISKMPLPTPVETPLNPPLPSVPSSIPSLLQTQKQETLVEASREELPSKQSSGDIASSLPGLAKRSFFKQKEKESSNIRDTLKALVSESPAQPVAETKEQGKGKKNPILEILAAERAKRLKKDLEEEMGSLWERIAAAAKKSTSKLKATPVVNMVPEQTEEALTKVQAPEKEVLQKAHSLSQHSSQAVQEDSPKVIIKPAVSVTMPTVFPPTDATISSERHLITISEEVPSVDLTSSLFQTPNRRPIEQVKSSLPPIFTGRTDDCRSDSNLRISKRSSSCLTDRQTSSECDLGGRRFLPQNAEDAEKLDEEYLKYYTTLMGSPFATPDLRRFSPALNLMPVHVILMARRMDIHASMQPYESRESDLLWIPHIQLALPPPASFPLLPFSIVVSLPPGGHPGDKYFSLLLQYHRSSRIHELRHMAENKRASSMVERSWLEFRDKQERFKYNFLTGQEIRTPQQKLTEFIPERTPTPHFVKLFARVKSRPQKTRSCSDFHNFLHSDRASKSQSRLSLV